MSALDRQEGGGHYKKYAIEPAEFCHRNNLSWCQANVVKYVVRFKDKGGFEDLRKARHYLDMLEEFEYGKAEEGPSQAPESLFGSDYDLWPFRTKDDSTKEPHPALSGSQRVQR